MGYKDFPGETVRAVTEKEVKQFGSAPQSDATSRAGGVGQVRSRVKAE